MLTCGNAGFQGNGVHVISSIHQYVTDPYVVCGPSTAAIGVARRHRPAGHRELQPVRRQAIGIPVANGHSVVTGCPYCAGPDGVA